MPADDNILVFVDIETSGLNARRDAILELGFVITDLDFEVIDKAAWTVGYEKEDLQHIYDTSDEYVQNLHDGNSLWEDCGIIGKPLSEIEDEAIHWIQEKGADGNPLAGSSLAMDRAFLNEQLPELHSLFHYRSIDNSTIKELCRRLNPSLYVKLPDSETDHRVFSCLDGTIAEAKFYADNFFFVED